VVGVVAPRVAQVDAAHVRDVPGRVVLVPDHHELLVVGAAGPHTHVEQRLGPALLQVLAEAPVLTCREPQLLPVRAPDQAAHVDAPLVGPSEHLRDLASRLAGQPLVGVALPVGEEDQVAGDRGLDALVELGEVRRAVDQRPDEVALGPRLLAGKPCVEAGPRVRALGLGEEPGLHLC
jgi:hypothetical protein